MRELIDLLILCNHRLHSTPRDASAMPSEKNRLARQMASCMMGVAMGYGKQAQGQLSGASGVSPTGNARFFDVVSGTNRPKAPIAITWHLFYVELLDPMLQYGMPR